MPEGLTHVIELEGFIFNFLLHSLFVFIVSFLRTFNRFGSSDDKLLIYTDNSSNSCYNGLTSYTYTEIIEELKKETWSPINENIVAWNTKNNLW